MFGQRFFVFRKVSHFVFASIVLWCRTEGIPCWWAGHVCFPVWQTLPLSPVCYCYWASRLPLSLPLPLPALFLLRVRLSLQSPLSMCLASLILPLRSPALPSLCTSRRRAAGSTSSVIQISEKRCVNSLVSHRAHWTTATSALRPLGLKSVTSDPWETLVHNDTGEQCGPSSVCPQRATVDCRSYNLSWIHHSPERGPLPSETTGLVEQSGPARVTRTRWCWDWGYGLCVFLCVWNVHVCVWERES